MSKKFILKNKRTLECEANSAPELPITYLSDLIQIPEGFTPGVFYIRVSTHGQEDRGNGLDVQRTAIENFAKRENIFQIGDFFEETVSGGAKLSDRPIFTEAISKALKYNAYIVTSKLDRLSRNSTVVSKMLEDKFKFVTAEYGFHADPLIIRIIAAVAEKERELISERTRAGMAQAKKRNEEQYQLDLETLGPELAVKKRFGAPKSLRSMNVKRIDGLERANRYVIDFFEPNTSEYIEKYDRKPTQTQLAEFMNSKGLKNEFGSDWTRSLIYHAYRKIRIDRKLQEDLD